MKTKSSLLLVRLAIPALLIILFLSGFIKPVSPYATGKAMYMLRDTVPETDTTERLFERVEIEARFPGGDEAWRKFLEKNLNGNVPLDNNAPNGYYTVVIQFVVDKTGAVSNITALTNHGYGMEAEVMRLLKKSPRWTPATQSGRYVRAYRKQPVVFYVENEKKKKDKNKSKKKDDD